MSQIMQTLVLKSIEECQMAAMFNLEIANSVTVSLTKLRIRLRIRIQ